MHCLSSMAGLRQLKKSQHLVTPSAPETIPMQQDTQLQTKQKEPPVFQAVRRFKAIVMGYLNSR